MSPSAERKKVAVFDPVERSRSLLEELLGGIGYQIEAHPTANKLTSRVRGPKAVDLLILNLSLLGDTYQQVKASLEQLDLATKDTPPIVAVTTLRLSQEARAQLGQLGAQEVLSQDAPLMELIFAVNRLLFPKIRELRRYTRVFGGFPVQFLHQGQWWDGEVYNISQEGAFIQCERPPSENSRLEVRFVLPGLEVPFSAQAQVNWVNDPAGEQDQLSPRGMGVSFLTLNQEENTSLDQFIAGRVNGNDPSHGSSSPSV